MLVELVVGYTFNALVLVADAYRESSLFYSDYSTQLIDGMTWNGDRYAH